MQKSVQPQMIHSSRRETSSLSIRVLLILACLTTFMADNVFGGPVYPQDTIYDGPKTPPPLSRPAYRQSVTDPTFGTTITRISGDEMNWTSLPYGSSNYQTIQHNYAKDQPWNVDMTKVKLTGGVYILNTSDWSIYRTSNWKNNTRWSTVDANTMYYTSGNSLYSWNVVTDVSTLIHTFSTHTTINIGDGEGNFSIGDRYVVINEDGQPYNTTFYDMQTNTELWNHMFSTTEASDWVSVSQSGTYIIASSNTGGGANLYNTVPTLLQSLFVTQRAQHADMGYNSTGQEVDAQMCPMIMARLDTGAATSLMGNPSPYYDCGHMSTRNYKLPGWAVIETETGTGFEILATKLDGSLTVRRFAHTRTTNSTYASQGKGVVSPDGSMVMWNSDWGSGTVYAYVAGMPQSSNTSAVPPAPPTGLVVK